MKKIISFCAALILSTGFAVAAESSFEVKVGAFFPYGAGQPNQISLDAGLAFNIGIDKAFTFGLEADLNWVDMSLYTATGSATTTVNSNIYAVPIYVTARFRFWQVYEDYGILPYIHLGVGYGLGFDVTTQLDDFYGGLAWQGFVGVAFKLHEASIVNLIIEVGAKGIHLQDLEGGLAAPMMIGFVARAGVRFAIKSDD